MVENQERMKEEEKGIEADTLEKRATEVGDRSRALSKIHVHAHSRT